MKKWLLLVVSVAFLGVVVAAHLIELVSPMVVAYILVMGIAGYVVYYLDKRLAVRGQERVPENFLLLLAAAGGWVGASIAKLQFRHKTSKWSFQWRYYLAVLFNIALIYLVIWLF